MLFTTTSREIDKRPCVVGVHNVELMLHGRAPMGGVGVATSVREGGRFKAVLSGYESYVGECRARGAMCGEGWEGVEEEKGDHIPKRRDDTLAVCRLNGMEGRAGEDIDVVRQVDWGAAIARGARDGRRWTGEGHVR
jgi:hypothetical protein